MCIFIDLINFKTFAYVITIYIYFFLLKVECFGVSHNLRDPQGIQYSKEVYLVGLASCSGSTHSQLYGFLIGSQL